MTYQELLEIVFSITGNVSFDYERTGYIFTFESAQVRDEVAIALIREGVAAVERREETDLFVQL